MASNKIISPFYLLVILLMTWGCRKEEKFGPGLRARSGPGSISQSVGNVRDPAIIKQDSIYYLYSTGTGIPVWSSRDLKIWRREDAVFANAPGWTMKAIPNFNNSIWAPDISYYKGQYYLFYCVSIFGTNRSAIGVATNKTLHPSDSNYLWTDHGPVLESHPGLHGWNAIDPSIISDNDGSAWLALGSFWGGIKMVKLTADRLKITDNVNNPVTIASIINTATPNNQLEPGGNAIEAPFIFKKNNYYYLFASIGYCCLGRESSYRIIVGRARTLPGPFLDKAGKRMDQGGGTVIFQGNRSWYGVGHNAVYSVGIDDYLLCHAYDATDDGKTKLLIEKLGWDKAGWPFIFP